MKNILFIVFVIIVTIIYSCKPNEGKDVSRELNQEYVVTIEKKIGDSIIYDEIVEYFANVSVSDSFYTWKKYYFNRVFEDLSLNGTAYIYDTVEIKVELEDNYDIKRIVNWETLYNRVKREVDRLIESAPDSRKEFIKDFAYGFSLDSSAIANKNTQDIQMFNVGFQFLYNEELIDTNVFLIKRKDSIETLYFKNNIPKSKHFAQLGSVLGITGSNNLTDYKMNIEIMKNTNSNKLIYLNYTISVSGEGVEKSIATSMIRIEN